MKILTKITGLLAILLLSGISWGQGFVLTSLQPNQPVYTSCDSVLSLSISALGLDTNSSEDVNLFLDGTNFTTSQFTTIISWGDGSQTTHVGGTSNPETAISFNPPLEHVYATSGSYTVIITVTNPLNNSTVVDTLTYNDVVCNTTAYLFASLDCDNDGTADSTIQTGIPVHMSNGNYSYFSTTNNGQAFFQNVFSGTYNLSIDQGWLAANGYSVTSIFGNFINVYPGSGVTTMAVNLICDTTSVTQSCLGGFVYCDADSSGSFTAGDTPMMNAPVMIQFNGQSITTYTNMNGYYSAVLGAAEGTPTVISINPNWLATNGYSAFFQPLTVLSGNCISQVQTNIPINCSGGVPCTNAACASVVVFCDANTNGIMDNGEVPIPNAPVQFMQGAMTLLATVYSDSNGYAQFCTNNFQNQYVFAQINQGWLQQHGYTSNTNILTLLTSNNTTPNPGYYAINCGGSGSQCADLWTTVTPWIGYYQGNTAYIKLNIGNYGPGTGYTYTVTMNFPVGVTPITSSINLPGYSISGNTITWNLTNAGPGYSYYDVIQFSVPTGLASGTAHYYTSTISATNNTTDCNATNNAGNLLQMVGSSYDPNDKSVDHEAAINPAAVETLTYVVRFQNTGTAPAQNIYILDTLSTNLDWATLEILETSHPMQLIDLGNGVKRFDFPQIWLPDSSANEPQSHGHVVYRIREKATNGIGSEIKNTAHIYFDWNDAIVTNTTYNINSALGLKQLDKNTVRVYPNPATSLLHVASDNTIDMLEIVDLTGKTLGQLDVNNTQTEVNLSNFDAGMYLVRLHTQAGIVTVSFVKK